MVTSPRETLFSQSDQMRRNTLWANKFTADLKLRLSLRLVEVGQVRLEKKTVTG